MVNEEKELEKELEKIGITKDVLDMIVSSAPSNQIMIGYPQEKIVSYIINDNW